MLVVRIGYVKFSEPSQPRRGDQRLSQGEVFALHCDDEWFEAEDGFGFGASWWVGEEEGDDRVEIGQVVGDEEPGAAFGFFFGLVCCMGWERIEIQPKQELVYVFFLYGFEFLAAGFVLLWFKFLVARFVFLWWVSSWLLGLVREEHEEQAEEHEQHYWKK